MALKTFEINLTNACNFKCNYCIVKNYTGTPIVPNRTILRRFNEFIKYMKNNCYKDDRLLLKIYGGEPLIYMNELVTLIPLFLRNVPEVTITTNGSLVRQNIDNFNKLRSLASKVDIGVSFDFMAQLENRSYEHYDDCLYGLKWLYEHHFCSTVLSVITPNTIEHMDILFDEFLKVKKELPGLRLRFRLDKTIDFNDIDEEKVRTGLNKIKTFINNNPEYGNSFRPNNSCGTMTNIDRDCFFGSAVLAVDAHDGTLYPGYNFRYQPKSIQDMLYIGNINDDFSKIVESRNALITKIDRKVNNECIGCNATCCFFPWYGNIITRLEDYNRMPAESHCKIHKLIAEYL